MVKVKVCADVNKTRPGYILSVLWGTARFLYLNAYVFVYLCRTVTFDHSWYER